MTNQEAIDYLFDPIGKREQHDEAIALAISVLQEQEEKNSNESSLTQKALDTISRQAAVDAALSFIVEYCGAAFDEDMQMELKQRLEDLPSAQPEPCEDAVSRADVIKEISESVCDLEYDCDNRALCEVIKALPPVTPKRKVSISEIRNQVAGEPVDLFTELTDEEKKQNKWYVQGYTDAMKRKTGKWAIKKGVLHPLEIDGICSKCGYTTGFYTLFKFCPNCGAKMSGGEQE